MPATDRFLKQVTKSHLGSGMMLLDLVTMPLTEISLFMSSGFRSLMTLCSAKLKGRTCAISQACAAYCYCCMCLLQSRDNLQNCYKAIEFCGAKYRKQLAVWELLALKISCNVSCLSIQKRYHLPRICYKLPIQLLVVLMEVHKVNVQKHLLVIQSLHKFREKLCQKLNF